MKLNLETRSHRPLTLAEAQFTVEVIHEDDDDLNCDVVKLAIGCGWHPVDIIMVVRILDRFTHSCADSDDSEDMAYIANAALDYLNENAAPLGYEFRLDPTLVVLPVRDSE
ncbi:hypothetical protein [Crossiella sp. NPDC003009]